MREVTFPATDEALQDANEFMESALEEAGCTMKNQMKIMVALEELFVNVVHYAYEDAGDDVDRYVKLALDFDDDDMILKIIDSGKPFNPLKKKDPDINLSAEERKIGGLGIYMVKQTMDEVDYDHDDGCNIVTIKHKIK